MSNPLTVKELDLLSEKKWFAWVTADPEALSSRAAAQIRSLLLDNNRLRKVCGNLLFAMSESITKRGVTQLREEAIEGIRAALAQVEGTA